MPRLSGPAGSDDDEPIPSEGAQVIRTNLADRLHELAWLSLGLVLIFTPFRYRFVLSARPLPPIYQGYTDAMLYLSDLFLAGALFCWLLSLALKPRRPVWGPLFLTLPVAGFIVFGAASSAVSMDPSFSLYHVIRLVMLAAMYLLLANSAQDLNRFAFAVALQVLIQAPPAIGQVLRQRSVGLESWGELALDPAWSGVSVVSTGEVRWLRAFGLTDHPNILGGCLAFALLLIAAWYLQAGARWRALAGAAFVLGLVSLLLTFSRAAWLAFAGGLLLMAVLLWMTHQRRLLLQLSLLVGIGLALMLPVVWQNVPYLGARLNVAHSFTRVTLEERSIAERLTLNDAVLQIVKEHPWTGVGLGTLPHALYYRFPSFPYNYQPAHLVLLEVNAEIGIPGLAYYLMALVGPWIALWYHRRRLSFTPALLGVSAALLAITIVSFFDYYTWLLVPGRLWQWSIWGLWSAIYLSSLREREDV